MHRQREREKEMPHLNLPTKQELFPRLEEEEVTRGVFPRLRKTSVAAGGVDRGTDRQAGRQDGRDPVRLLAKVAPFLLWESPHDYSRRRLLATRPPSFEAHCTALKCLGDHFCSRFLCSRRSLALAYLPYPFPLSNFATGKHSRRDRRSNSPS